MHLAGCFSSRVDGMSRPGNDELRGARVGITHHLLVWPFAAITVRASRVVLKKRVCHGSNIVKKIRVQTWAVARTTTMRRRRDFDKGSWVGSGQVSESRLLIPRGDAQSIRPAGVLHDNYPAIAPA